MEYDHTPHLQQVHERLLYQYTEKTKYHEKSKTEKSDKYQQT